MNINPIVIVFWANLGMVVGDTISFLLGKMIGNKVEDWIPEKYHHYLVSARKFMKKRGILSVALGRFAGPLRCTVPFIAGSLGMKSKLFGVIFVEYFTYTLIAIILIASFYTAYKGPLKTRK